jgi:alkanesulfonate monooxygenase SsuD/methylene tetrahydromethanopterin reductase-like flavin-dependent oxidoreductase (luciferase family)
VRVQQLEEALQIIQAMWTEKQASFVGTYYRVTDVYGEPKPDPPPPIIIGAFKPKMLRLTARYGDNWNVSSTGIHNYRRLVEEFERACAEVGRDPATVRRSWSGGCVCAPTQAEAERLAGARYRTDEDDFSFVGTPTHIVEQMRAFIELGVDYFMVDCGGFPDLTTLELLVNEVVPALNDRIA